MDTTYSPLRIDSTDIEQIREGLAVFGVALWENGLPELKYDDGPFFDESQTVMWGWDL